MCGLNFAGGSEFVAIELWRHPPLLFLIVGMTFLVNSRHLLMGATLAPRMRTLSAPKACLTLFFMADEIWAFGLEEARSRDEEFATAQLSLPFYAGLAAGLYGTWLVSTTVGALIGPRVGDPQVPRIGHGISCCISRNLKRSLEGPQSRNTVGSQFGRSGGRASLHIGLVVRGRRDCGWTDRRLSLVRAKKMLRGWGLLTILGMAFVTYLTRILGYWVLRRHTLGEKAAIVLEAAPGCVLICVIAPVFATSRPSNLIALGLTVLAATRLPMLPTVAIGVSSAALLRHFFG